MSASPTAMGVRKWLRTVAVLLGAAVLCGGANQFHQEVDRVRFEAGAKQIRVFLPDPKALRAVTLGYHTVLADVLWVRTVLMFVDIIDQTNEGDAEWLRLMLQTVSTLDPRWRTTYFYGGGMLRLVNDVEGSDEIYEGGMRAFPEDAFFPFSIGMNAYLYHHDTGRAFEFLREAARLPNAPKWYGAAAAAFLDEHGQRKAALKYLREEIDAAQDDAVKDALKNKYARVLHDELAAQLENQRTIFQSERGRDIHSVEELADIPPEPYGERWVLALDGVIRSSVRDSEIAKSGQNSERKMMLTPFEDYRR